MKTTILSAAVLASFSTVALSQTTGSQTPAATVNQTPQTTAAPNPSAVQTNDPASRTAAAPVSGHNSFTASEAASRIQSRGFTDVKELKQDDQGVWRGKAMQGGQPVPVALDYQGNVVSK